MAERAPGRMLLDLGLREANDFAAWDLDSVQPEPVRIDAVVAVRRVPRAEAEVLARLRDVLVDPELERGLLGSRQRAREPARPPQQRIHSVGERAGVRRG